MQGRNKTKKNALPIALLQHTQLWNKLLQNVLPVVSSPCQCTCTAITVLEECVTCLLPEKADDDKYVLCDTRGSW